MIDGLYDDTLALLPECVRFRKGEKPGRVLPRLSRALVVSGNIGGYEYGITDYRITVQYTFT